MENKPDLKCYNSSFTEDSIELTLKPRTKDQIQFENDAKSIFFALPIFFIILGIFTAIRENHYFFIIAGPILLVGMIYANINQTKKQKWQEENFRLIIDSTGVTHIELKKMFHLSWDEIESFGVVNQVRTLKEGKYSVPFERNTRAFNQTVLYFSINKYTLKEDLRYDLLPKITQRAYRTSRQMIVFEFWEENLETVIFEHFYPCIHKYCDADKEVSSVEMEPLEERLI